MKTKMWIQNKIFIVFSIFIIFILNIIFFIVYFFVRQNYISDVTKNIAVEYETIVNFVDLQKDSIFVMPEYELKNINSLWFFFYIWNNDKKLKSEYKKWFNYYKNYEELAYRWDYRWYNIIIWKNITDIYKIQSTFLNLILFINLIVIFLVFILTYFLSKTLLKPLSNISKHITEYDLNKPKKIFKNDYWTSEIWVYIDSTNNFLTKISNIFSSQKDFIQDVSHELKTPLMQIESSIEIIENKITDEKILEKITNIKSTVWKINSIISNLSFLLRWEEWNLVREKVKIWDFLDKFIIDYIDLANSKNILIKLEILKDFEIISNKYYLERLFSNLIMNSIYYNNWNNELKIIVNKSLVEIIDKWIWIKQEDLEKIYNRFYRNTESWIYNKNWNWLWLSIVKKVCDIFNWEIKITSKVWIWSHFTINFKS